MTVTNVIVPVSFRLAVDYVIVLRLQKDGHHGSCISATWHAIDNEDKAYMRIAAASYFNQSVKTFT
jgi:hypothetical protein